MHFWAEQGFCHHHLIIYRGQKDRDKQSVDLPFKMVANSFFLSNNESLTNMKKINKLHYNQCPTPQFSVYCCTTLVLTKCDRNWFRKTPANVTDN